MYTGVANNQFNLIVGISFIMTASIDRHGVSNFRSNSLLRRATKKHKRPALPSLCEGIHRSPVVFMHKGTVTRKMLPFDDVTMCWVTKRNKLQSHINCHYLRAVTTLSFLNTSAFFKTDFHLNASFAKKQSMIYQPLSTTYTLITKNTPGVVPVSDGVCL